MHIDQGGKLADSTVDSDPFINQTPDYALFILDTSGCVISWSAGAERLKGYSTQEIVGRHFSDFYTAEDVEKEKPYRALEIAAREGTCQDEGLRVRKDGSRFWATTTITALRDQDGTLQGYAKLTRGIPEHNTSESALKANEAKYRGLYEHSNNAIFLTRPEDGAILSVNPAACSLLGYSEQELTSMRREQVLDMTEPRLPVAWTQRAQVGAATTELTFICKGGRRFDAWVESKLFTDESGQQLACTSVQDITERKQAEEALRQSEERFRLLYDNAPIGIAHFDKNGFCIFANRKLAEIVGYSPEEVARLRYLDVAPEEDRDLSIHLMEKLLSGELEASNRERLVLRKDGSTVWVRQSARIVRDTLGNPQYGIATFEDITERKQAEEALRQSEEQFRLLYENAPLGIIHIDQNGNLTSANKKFAEISGYSSEETVGLVHTDIIPPEERQTSRELVEELFAGKREIVNRERRVLRKDASTIWVRLTAKIMHDTLGNPQWGMVVFEDITERKQAEEALRQSEEQFRLLYENAPLGIIHIDQNGHLTSANKKFAEISGYSPEEAVGLAGADIALPEDREVVSERMERLLSGDMEIVNRERRLLRKNGSTIWVRVTTKIMRDTLGKPQWGIAVFEDITERKQAEEALRQSEEKFRATFEHAPLGIAECTVDGRIIEANSKLADILGYTKDELAHLTIADLTHPGDMEDTLSNLQKLATGEADSDVMEKRNLRKDRSYVWVNITASLAPIHAKPHYLVLTIEDITARKKIEEDLKMAMEWSYHQANHDMLTGLANRAAFNDRLTDALAYAKRDGHLVAIHLLDLDGFKSINDTLGHHIGDLLLQDVATRIKSVVRASDLVARLGGDEFVVIQTHLAEPAAAAVLAAKLVEGLGRKYVLENQEVHSGTSLGVALYPNDAEDSEQLIKQADLALYDAKHRGRFNFQFYREELGVAFREAQRVEQELVRALRENEFFLHYQPQFDLKGGRITGIEALLRWRHPTRGILAAAEFIQEAERARLMPTIGEWTLKTACRQYKEWTGFGFSVPLTLNLSSMQLRDPRFLQIVNRILEETGLPPSLLQLEMRESVLWDPKLSKNVLNQLKESGLRLALEEFGTELTALSTLGRFPLDAVKPGQGLVRELASRGQEATVLAAIIGVAHNLKIAVCADGIETANQLTAVKEQGCDSAQGYLLSLPLDTDEMTRLIEVELAH